MADHLGLVEAVDAFRQRIVVRVALAADRGFDPGVQQPLGIAEASYCTLRSPWCISGVGLAYLARRSIARLGAPT
jgi:hypothetical protein